MISINKKTETLSMSNLGKNLKDEEVPKIGTKQILAVILKLKRKEKGLLQSMVPQQKFVFHL